MVSITSWSSVIQSQYRPLIGQNWSHDLNTRLWLVTPNSDTKQALAAKIHLPAGHFVFADFYRLRISSICNFTLLAIKKFLTFWCNFQILYQSHCALNHHASKNYKSEFTGCCTLSVSSFTVMIFKDPGIKQWPFVTFLVHPSNF